MDKDDGIIEVHKHLFSEETEDFLKGFVFTMVVLAASSVLLLIPPSFLGITLLLTVGPYIAGYKGGYFTKEWIWLAFVSAMIWSSVQTMVIIALATELSYYGSAEIGSLELLAIFGIYLANTLFCMVGAKIGWQRQKKKLRIRDRQNRSSRA